MLYFSRMSTDPAMQSDFIGAAARGAKVVIGAGAMAPKAEGILKAPKTKL